MDILLLQSFIYFFLVFPYTLAQVNDPSNLRPIGFIINRPQSSLQDFSQLQSNDREFSQDSFRDFNQFRSSEQPQRFFQFRIPQQQRFSQSQFFQDQFTQSEPPKSQIPLSDVSQSEVRNSQNLDQSESFDPQISQNEFRESKNLDQSRPFKDASNNKQDGKSSSMSETCLACLCTAATSCNLSTQCLSRGRYCGAFLISKPYWIDAGKPTLLEDSPDREGAFQDCGVDPNCAAETVRRYMNKFQKDCNSDGKIDCDDMARIHLMGPFSDECQSPSVLSTGFYTKFKKCWASVQQLS